MCVLSKVRCCWGQINGGRMLDHAVFGHEEISCNGIIHQLPSVHRLKYWFYTWASSTIASLDEAGKKLGLLTNQMTAF